MPDPDAQGSKRYHTQDSIGSRAAEMRHGVIYQPLATKPANKPCNAQAETIHHTIRQPLATKPAGMKLRTANMHTRESQIGTSTDCDQTE